MKAIPFWRRLAVASLPAVTLALPALNALTLDDVWINEFHYDNDGGDTGEFVEVAAKAGVDLTGLTIDLYNGSGGATYGAQETLGDADTDVVVDGIRYLVFTFSNSIQNGPDGIALAVGSLIQFLSYEGSFIATDGPAIGLASTDIGVNESGSTDIGESIQLTGNGYAYGDFAWTANLTETPGASNTGQSFQAPVTQPPPADQTSGVPDSGATALLLGSALAALLYQRRKA